MTSDIRLGVAIPAYARPALLGQLVETIPSWVDAFVSDNYNSLRDSALNLPENVRISHHHALIPMFSNWNRALSLVSPEVTHVLVPSDDDLYLPNAFDHVLQAVKQHGDADIFIFGCGFVDEFNNSRAGYEPEALEVFEAGQGFLKFKYGVDARMPGIVFRRQFLDRIGAFDQDFQLTAADSDLVQRALLLGKSVFVPTTIGLYRIWSGSLTHKRQATDEWMNEIHLWTDKIVDLIKRKASPLSEGQVDLLRYKDEILTQNILAAVAGLISRKEYAAARAFIRQHPGRRAAKLRTKFSLARRQLLIWLHS